MCDRLHFFGTPAEGLACVALPFELESMIGDWSSMTGTMARKQPEAFSRDEWAYVISFLDARFLRDVFTKTFGPPADGRTGAVQHLHRPRGNTAVWLPNNVSLLGPLVLIMVSLTGNSVTLKVGSHGPNLTRCFLDYLLETLRDGVLKDYLTDRVRVMSFPRNAMEQRVVAENGQVRLAFGSDAAAEAIESLPHPLGSMGFPFVDRQSEVWLEPGAADDDLLRVLLRVMAVYGRLGCTSPRRVVVLDGSLRDAANLCERLAGLWPSVVRRDVEPHTASENVLCMQWAAATGWTPRLAPRNGAMFAAGRFALPEFSGAMAFPVLFGSREETLAHLPSNIQTIGHALTHPESASWLRLLGRTYIKRFVPVARMHHFGPIWDGYSFWRAMFESVEVGL